MEKERYKKRISVIFNTIKIIIFIMAWIVCCVYMHLFMECLKINFLLFKIIASIISLVAISIIVSFMFLNTVVMTAMSNLKFSKRSDLLIIALKITLTAILLVGGIYLLERYMMDIDNQKILWN